MNKYTKNQSTPVLQVLTSIIDEMSEEQHESVLDGTSTVKVISKNSESIFEIVENFISKLTNEQIKDILIGTDIIKIISKDREPIFEMLENFINKLSDEQTKAILDGTMVLELKYMDSTLPNINIETIKQNSDFNIDEILNKIKSSDRNSAKVILLDTNISKELCLDILNNLNIKSSTRCKKETLVNKILDNIFADNNVSIYNDLIEQLKNVENREQARKILTDSKLKVAELKKLASIMKISLIDKTKDRIIYSIVQRVIGDRLDTEAIMSVKLK